MIRIKKGLSLPIAGEPKQSLQDGPQISTVAIVGDDYIGMKPTMAVHEGDAVKLGQLLFTDKKTPGVQYRSPGCGTVVAIHRGAKRAFQSLVIRLEGDDEETFPSYVDADLSTLAREPVRDLLVESGLWTALRTRPYSKVPAIDSAPHSLFVTAIDTDPLAARPELVIGERPRDFVYGLQVLRQLTDGPVYLCTARSADIPGRDVEGIRVEEFAGPHPAGLPGTHIHFLDPVDDHKTVWHIGYQDVLAVGRLFVTGRLPVERVISLAGPGIENPRLIRTRLGAATAELTANSLVPGEVRVVSGSVLAGRKSVPPFDFLGRYHRQVSTIPEDRRRRFLDWLKPGLDKFSVKRVFACAFFSGGRKFAMTTATGGSKRAMVPIGMYEQVVPLDVIPTFLLRSLIVGDTERAQELGCLELDEEDLALCTFVCPGKYEYGPILRDNLTQIEREG